MKQNLDIPQEEMVAFCSRWNIQELALFGSALREDFGPESDIDVLVTFASEARWTLFDLVGMQEELQRLFGRPVDLVSRRGLEASRNYLRREAIFSEAEVVYAA